MRANAKSKKWVIYKLLLHSHHVMLQVIYLEVEPMAKQYGINIDVLLGTP
jgi:hypothetical protein